MAVPEPLIWILLLAASVLLCADGAGAWTVRRDPRVAVLTCGLAGGACLVLAAISSSPGA